MIQHPFIHHETVKKEFSPVENPSLYRAEFVRSLYFLILLQPLIEDGLVSLVPDPCDFDHHLRDQMFNLSTQRSQFFRPDEALDRKMQAYSKEDLYRSLLGQSEGSSINCLDKQGVLGELGGLEAVIAARKELLAEDPLGVIQDVAPDVSKQFLSMKMAPNFEIAMFLAQATGSVLFTDSPVRWQEFVWALARRNKSRFPLLHRMSELIANEPTKFPVDLDQIFNLHGRPEFINMRNVLMRTFNYLSGFSIDRRKPNVEAQLAAHFERHRNAVNKTLKQRKTFCSVGKMRAAFYSGGVQDNTINRLLLMSTSTNYLSSVPMVFFVDGEAN